MRDLTLKIYRDSTELLAEIECVLAASRPSFHRSPLQDVIESLCHGRHATWVGIYLAAGTTSQQLLGAGGGPHPGQMARPETKSKILVSMKLAGHEFGVLDVESDRENAFGPEDRVLLEKVANLLARFLAGPGRYLARKARLTAMAKSYREEA
jgi:putative methionine-R-sulfoxide reductase with GAF domain